VDILTVYIVVVTVLALSIALRGVVVLQVVMGVCGAGATVLLWLTYLSDPGKIPPCAERGACLKAMRAGGAG